MIKYFNIRSGETREAETEPQIAALYNSSDLGINSRVGQDFGWRLAPEVVVQMRQIKDDYNLLIQIAQRRNKNVDELTDPDILHYISSQTSPQQAPVARQDDYQDVYDLEVRRKLREAEETKLDPDTLEPEETTTTTTTKSIEDLEAELKARKAETTTTTTKKK